MAKLEYFPTAGPIQADKYPFVRDNYNKYGEQNGFVYDPWTDQYWQDPKIASDYYEQTGFTEPAPKEPSLTEQLLPVAATAGTIGAAQGFFENPSGFIGGLGDIGNKVAGLFGMGNGGAAAAPAAATSATSAPAAAALAAPSTPSLISATPMSASAAPAATPGLFSLSSMLPAAGVAAIGAYTANKGMDAYKKGQGKGLLGGLKAGIKEAGPLSFVPVLGQLPWAAGAVGGLLGDGDKWKTEKRKLSKLKDQGVYLPDNLLSSMPKGGRSRDELINKTLASDFIGRDSQGNWVNNAFASTRDEKFLRPEDIVNYSAFAERDPSWFKKPLDQRLAEAKRYLDAGAVKEEKGTIKLNDKKLAAAPTPTAPPTAADAKKKNSGRPVPK